MSPQIGGPATFVSQLTNRLLRDEIPFSVIAVATNSSEQIKKKSPGVHLIRDRNRLLRTLSLIVRIFWELRDSRNLICCGLFVETAVANIFWRKTSLVRIVGDPVWERAQNNGETSLPLEAFIDSKISLKLKFQRLVYNWAFRQFAVCITPNQPLSTTITHFYKGLKPLVIPNGIQLDEVNEISPFIFDVVYVGRLVKWKNIDILIDALKDTNLKLAIVGDGPEKEVLEQKAQGARNIVFIESVDAEEVRRLLRVSKVFCLLSTYEGLSFSMLEAMATGKAVVASDIEANRIINFYGSICGILVPVRDVIKTREALVKLIQHEEMQKQMGISAQEVIRTHFQIDGQLTKILEMLDV